MQARHDVLGAEHVAVDQSKVLLAVAIVPESDDLETAEARRQMSDGLDPDADAMGAEALAVVVFVALDEIRETGDGGE